MGSYFGKYWGTPYHGGGGGSSSLTSYLDHIVAQRSDILSGQEGLAEMSATVQGCVNLWEHGLSLADVDSTSLLARRHMALIGRALALRGEAVFYIGDGELFPCYDWQVSTRLSKPIAYRVSIADQGGGTTRTALAGEVLHFSIGADVNMPYVGLPPLRRSGLTAALLQHLETALCEIYANAPLGSQIVPFPEAPETDMQSIARGFRGSRDRVLVRESVNVAAAGGPARLSVPCWPFYYSAG